MYAHAVFGRIPRFETEQSSELPTNELSSSASMAPSQSGNQFVSARCARVDKKMYGELFAGIVIDDCAVFSIGEYVTTNCY